ncbi:zinc ribbon domain-containing protein [Colwellia sp. KU-HH00111]|uniref:zinc ribbon domain-containing protein n=1 Tax=Colwellia sp. KU-HH00111 TaxID=3127652 RepID=UPI00310B089F
MAVINCPSCKKKISDKANACSHCGLSLQALDTDKIANLAKVNRINQAQRLMNYSFIAMLLFCGGFLFMFWDNVEQGTWQYLLAMTSTIIGFILYIVIRIRLLFFKRQK